MAMQNELALAALKIQLLPNYLNNLDTQQTTKYSAVLSALTI